MAMPNIADLVKSAGGVTGAFGKGDPVGKTVSGRIVAADVQQVRDIKTSDLEFWDGDPTQPKLQVRVIVQTDARDDEKDDGQRAIYVKWWGGQRAALLTALREAEDDDVHVGGHFTATFTHEIPSDQRGMSPTKVFEFTYQKPGAGIAGLNPGEQVNQSTGEITPTPGATGGAPQAAVQAQQQAAQQAQQAQVAQAPAQAAAAPQTGAQQVSVDVDKVKQFIGLGMQDHEVAGALGYTPEVVAAIRALG